MDRGIQAFAEFTELLAYASIRTPNGLEQAKALMHDRYSDMSKEQLRDIILELITSIQANTDLTTADVITTDVAIELDEKYDKAYQ